MVDEEAYCIDILTQVSAATMALEVVVLGLLDEHLTHRVAGAARLDGYAAEAKIQEASEAIARLVHSVPTPGHPAGHSTTERKHPRVHRMLLLYDTTVNATVEAGTSATGSAEVSQYTVTGMTCGHCVSSVTEEIQQIDGVRDVEVDLTIGSVTVTADQPITAVTAAVREAGCQVA